MNRNRPYNPSSSRPHTYGVRHWSYAATATEPCRPTACERGWPQPAPIDHCSPITVPWTFTFSAKERDSETGLSYFGSRYYSSDLSIWLSVDPMAHKYPSFSPYTYCADNPVKLVDPNGEEWLRKEDEEYAGSLISIAEFMGWSTMEPGSADYYNELNGTSVPNFYKKRAIEYINTGQYKSPR